MLNPYGEQKTQAGMVMRIFGNVLLFFLNHKMNFISLSIIRWNVMLYRHTRPLQDNQLFKLKRLFSYRSVQIKYIHPQLYLVFFDNEQMLW